MPVLPDLPATEAAIVEMTNAFRARNGLSPVVQNPKLTAAAVAYAKTLTAYKGLSHTADGTTAAQRIDAVRYGHCQIAENLASLLDSRGFTASEYARSAVEGWENSPGHRRNMLLPHVTETGVGIARAPTKEPKYIAVQLFARPVTFKYKFKVVNRAQHAITYALNGKDNTIEPREIVTHTACTPGTLAFNQGVDPIRTFTAKGGAVFAIKPNANGSGAAVTLEAAYDAKR